MGISRMTPLKSAVQWTKRKNPEYVCRCIVRQTGLRGFFVNYNKHSDSLLSYSKKKNNLKVKTRRLFGR